MFLWCWMAGGSGRTDTSVNTLPHTGLWGPVALVRMLHTEVLSNDALANFLLYWGASRFLGIGEHCRKECESFKKSQTSPKTDVSLQRVFVRNCMKGSCWPEALLCALTSEEKKRGEGCCSRSMCLEAKFFQTESTGHKGMAQKVREPATESEDLSIIPRTHTVEGRWTSIGILCASRPYKCYEMF